MKKYYSTLVAIVFFSAGAYSQNTGEKEIKGTFVGLWAGTVWSYVFNSDKTYKYQSTGHFGNSLTLGQYRISQDTLILNAFSKSQQRDTNFYFQTDTLIIDSDNCLIDLTTGYEHLRLKEENDTVYASKRRNLKLLGRPVLIEY